MKKTIIYSVIVLLVVAGFVYITINGKQEKTSMQQKTGYEKVIVQEGQGEAAKPGDMVSMNYTGILPDGTVFDSNVDPKFQHVEPFTFTLGAGQVIKGWDEGIVGMKPGEKAKLVISPDYGYGSMDYGPIPANSTLTFEVELLSIQNNNNVQ